MKSTTAVIATLASTALAQPHGHGHAHLHPARLEHQHHHAHEKRVLETETVIEWTTETVIELIQGTTTEWITQLPSTTTFATVTTSSSEAGQFFEPASSSSPTLPSVAPPVETQSPDSSAVVAPAPPAPTTSSTSVVVAPAPAPTTSETPAVVVEPTTSASIAAPAPAETSSTTSPSSGSGTTTGWKITWIGDTTGALSACGQPYEAGSMYVAVNPAVLDCGSDGMGTSMSITANGKTVSAVAIDKCMGCDPSHIDVATAVYEALGYTTTDGGMHNTGMIDWTIG